MCNCPPNSAWFVQQSPHMGTIERMGKYLRQLWESCRNYIFLWTWLIFELGRCKKQYLFCFVFGTHPEVLLGLTLGSVVREPYGDIKPTIPYLQYNVLKCPQVVYLFKWILKCKTPVSSTLSYFYSRYISVSASGRSECLYLPWWLILILFNYCPCMLMNTTLVGIISFTFI